MHWNCNYRTRPDLSILPRGKNDFVIATSMASTQTACMDAASLEVLSHFVEPCTPRTAFEHFRDELGVPETLFEEAIHEMLESALLVPVDGAESVETHAIVSLAERPDLVELAVESAPDIVRELFRRESLPRNHAARDTSIFDLFLRYQAVEWDGRRIVAHLTSLPIHWNRPLTELPEEGFDWAVARALQDADEGTTPTMLVGLNIDMSADQLGAGQSYRMVEAMRRIAAASDLEGLIIPLRPTRKSDYPLVPMERYLTWTREDGLPYDPWLRVHVKSGGRVIKVCSRSMVNRAPISTFEECSGLHFPESGAYPIPNHLAPVLIDRESGCGTYVEPNVWVFHPVP